MYSNCGTVEIRTGEVSVEAGREKEGGGTVYCRGGEGGRGGGHPTVARNRTTSSPHAVALLAVNNQGIARLS